METIDIEDFIFVNKTCLHKIEHKTLFIEEYIFKTFCLVVKPYRIVLSYEGHIYNQAVLISVKCISIKKRDKVHRKELVKGLTYIKAEMLLFFVIIIRRYAAPLASYCLSSLYSDSLRRG